MNEQLRKLIQAEIGKHPGAGPEELAYYVAHSTPVDEMRTLFASVLVGSCRSAINQHRHGRSGRRPKAKPTPPVVPTPYPRPVPKLSERRNWWAEELLKEMRVADGVKPLGDCTADDLRFCIKERETTIDRITGQVGRLTRILTLLERAHAEKVRDLPAQTEWRPAS